MWSNNPVYSGRVMRNFSTTTSDVLNTTMTCLDY